MMKNFLGLQFEDVDIHTVFSRIRCGDLDSKIVVTPNVDHVNRFHKDCSFRALYTRSDLFLNDSRVLRFLSRLPRFETLYNVVPGSDLTKHIVTNFGELSDKYSICVVGGVEEDVEVIKSKFGIENIYQFIPPFGFEDSEEEIERCLEFCLGLPRSIFLMSVGSPKQEFLADRLRCAGVDGVFLCVGASVLFLSGRERRAPKFIQKIGFEWAYRLIQQPKRLYRRYLVDGPYIGRLLCKYYWGGKYD